MKEKSEYLQAAIEIGDQLLAQKEEKNGYSWKTLTMGSEGKVEHATSESLYSGVAGIIFFFMELYKRTHEEKYLDAVKQGAAWLEHYCKDNPSVYYAFYTGRMGIAYLMILLSDFLKDDSYLSKAVEIAKGCESFLEGSQPIDDLINGASGTLLGLLHVYDATKDQVILQQIQKYTDHLINRINFGEKGFYWDRSSKNIKGLCGFSHGSAGIGYAFLELGRYFQNDTFYRIAEEAFKYENHLFDSEKCNWPDLRKNYYDDATYEEFRKEYMEGNMDYFLKAGNMSAWCHGAPGVGLSRIRATELLKKEEYSDDLKNAVDKTIEATIDFEHEFASYTLCHGGGGNAILLMEFDRLTRGTKYLKSVQEVANRAIRSRKKLNMYICGFSMAGEEEDYSLFMGNAGIGYYYLLVHDGNLSDPSILKPDVNGVFIGEKHGSLALTNNQLKLKLFEKLFPKLSKQLNSEINADEIDEKNGYLEGLLNYTEQLVSKIDNENVTQIWEYEYYKHKVDHAITSHSYLEIQSIFRLEKNEALLKKSDDEFLEQTFVKPHHFELKMLASGIISDDPDENYVLFVPTSMGIVEFSLTIFSYTVLEKFKSPKTIRKVLNEMVSEYDVEIEEEVRQVKDATLNQIKEAIKQGILSVPEPAYSNP